MACDIDKLTGLLDIDQASIVGIGSKVKMPCPLHSGSDPNMWVDLEGEGWYCHSVCQRGGKLTDLVAEYRNITAEEASLLLRGTKSFVPSKTAAVRKPAIRLHSPREPAGHLPLGIEVEDTYRHIDKATLLKFKVYYCTHGRYSDRVIIPLYNEDGEYIGFQARRLYSHDIIGKYVFSPGVESGLILYNYNNARRHRILHIVEGVFGVMNFHQHGIENVVGLVGGGLGPKRVHLLKNHEIVVCVDNDLAGDRYREKIQDASLSVRDIIIPPLGIEFDEMAKPWFNRLVPHPTKIQVHEEKST